MPAQRDLSIAYGKLGEVSFRLNQVARALRYYQDGLKISEQLAERDPDDAQAKRDLSISYERLGDVSLRLNQTAQRYSIIKIT